MHLEAFIVSIRKYCMAMAHVLEYLIHSCSWGGLQAIPLAPILRAELRG